MANYELGNSSEGEHLVGATDPVLDSLDVLFNFGRASTVPKCSFLEVVTKNGMEFTNMMSIARTVLVFCSMILIGTMLVWSCWCLALQ